MKPYCDINGKAAWNICWGDRTKSRHKKVFKKSARSKINKETEQELLNELESWDRYTDILCEIYDEDWHTKIF